MKLRILMALTLAVTLMGALTFAIDGAGAASAQAVNPSLPTTCVNTNTNPATTFPCNLNLTGFQVINGVLNAVGTVTNSAGQVIANFTAPVSATGTCQILDLTVGPIHLDLLGLQVSTNMIHLNITAQSGPGRLLGNLLCDVANLLNQNNLTGLAGLLNNLLGGLGVA